MSLIFYRVEFLAPLQEENSGSNDCKIDGKFCWYGTGLSSAKAQLTSNKLKYKINIEVHRSFALYFRIECIKVEDIPLFKWLRCQFDGPIKFVVIMIVCGMR